MTSITSEPTAKPRRIPPFHCWLCRERLAPRDYHYLIRWEETPRVCCPRCLTEHDPWGRNYWFGFRAETATELGLEQHR